MSISRQDIDHVAELAHLELSEAEKERFSEQLGSVLEYVDSLKEVDTTGVEPTAQVSGLVDVWRSDEVSDWERDEVLSALRQGEYEGGYVKVKKVL